MLGSIRKFSFSFLALSCFILPIHASEVDCLDDDTYLIEDDCYCSTPIKQGEWNISIKGGIAPTTWLNRRNEYVVSINQQNTPIVTSKNIGSFEDNFDMPWTASVEVAYNISDYSQIFVEGSYKSAPNKKSTKKEVDGIKLRERTDDAHDWSGYFGVRQFFCRDWVCDSVAPYIGFKAGFVNHQKINTHFYVGKVAQNQNQNQNQNEAQNKPQIVYNEIGKQVQFQSTTGISAGAFIGLDCALMESLNIQLQIEVIASQPIQGRQNVEFPGSRTLQPGEITNIMAGKINSELTFPITVGLRYSF